MFPGTELVMWIKDAYETVLDFTVTQLKKKKKLTNQASYSQVYTTKN